MKKIIFLTLITIISMSFIITFSHNLFGKDKKNNLRCKNLVLSEKSFIDKCSTLVTPSQQYENDLAEEIKTKTFCRCIFRTFNVRLWADKKCSYYKAGNSIMVLANYNVYVQESCGYLKP